MGFDTRRPPLPAPTESMDESNISGPDTEVGTTLTTRTDKTSYSIPEDGRPITISTQKLNASRGPDGKLARHGRQKSQTSLLIEYFEASKTGDKSRSKPSVRVKVTPSSAKKSRAGNDAIQITGIGSDRKPSYTRRISLGGKHAEAAGAGTAAAPLEGTDLSHSSDDRHPVEIEVLPSGSDVSNARSSRGLLYAPFESNVSSMPPDSMLESGGLADSELSRGYDPADDESTLKDGDYLTAPPNRSDSRSRSASRERLTQKVMEKLGAGTGLGAAGIALASSGKPRKSSRELSAKEREYDAQARERRRRSSKSHRSATEDDPLGSEASYISSARSYRSGDSQASRVTNNPKLLEMVEDTIKRMILPELNALKEDQRTQKKTDRNLRSFEEKSASSRRGESDYDLPTTGLERRVSKSSSSPNIVTSKPKVVLNRDGENPGTVLSRGDSERIKVRKSSREERPGEHRRSSSRKSSGRHSTSRRTSYEDYASDRDRERNGSHKTRDALAAAAVGGALTAAALKHHDSQSDIAERAAHRKRRSSKSRGSRSRSASITDAAGEDSYHHCHHRKDPIPPLPMASRINDSDLTRDSLRSSRGSLAEVPGTPTRGTPVSRARENDAARFTRGSASPSSPAPGHGRSATSRTAALAKSLEQRHMDADGYGSPVSASGGGAASPAYALHHRQQIASPTQSVSSLKKNFEEVRRHEDAGEEEPLVPRGLRTRASRSSAAVPHHERSQSSFRSGESSPTAKLLAVSRGPSSSRDVSMDDIFATPMERSHADVLHDDEDDDAERGLPSGALTPVGGGPGAGGGETADEWFARQHAVNDHYRDSLVSGETGLGDDAGGRESNRDSYQTNPFPQDERRFTTYTEDSLEQQHDPQAAEGGSGDLGVRPVAANKGIPRPVVLSPHPAVAGVESAVASLMEPSTVSSNLRSTSTTAGGGADSTGSPAAGTRGSYSDRMAEHLRAAHAASPPALYEGSTLSQTMPSQDRWAALRMSAHSLGSAGSGASPAPSPARRPGGAREISSSSSLPRMSASGIPRAGDPAMPAIGHFDELAAAGSGSDLTTNPSIIQGPLGGDPTGKSEWPYTPDPAVSAHAHAKKEGEEQLHAARKGDAAGLGLAAAAALAGAGVAMAAANRNSHTSDDPHRYTPDLGRHRNLATQRFDRDDGLVPSGAGSPAAPFRDEGYITDAHTLSRDALTPELDERLPAHGRYAQPPLRAEGQQPRYGKEDLEAYARAMDAHADSEDELEEDEEEDLAGEALPPRALGEDPFTTTTANAAARGAGIGAAANANAHANASATPSPGPATADAEHNAADDPLAAHVRRARHFSANSHGMGSPLYDSATGAGIERIQSRDIVALMDHLTVRDAQRNARDTEILVTLVRSAAEMRQSFDEMKRFIVEQDQLIMRDAQRNGEVTAQRVLQGPRPLPGSGAASPRTPRRGAGPAAGPTPEEDAVQAKRKGVLRRALKGLTGGKSANDLVRIEDMLMQILDNVEDLKQQGGGPGAAAGTPGAGAGGADAKTPAMPPGTKGGVPPAPLGGAPPILAFGAAVPGQIDPLTSYEKLRGAPDYGTDYDSEDRDGAATPTQAGQYALSSSSKQQFHSGYDGRRGSATRVSTVLEDDEDDDLLPHEAHVLDHQFENNERLLTPTQEVPRARGGLNSPAAAAAAAVAPAGVSPEKHRKTKSNGSGSLFGIQNMIPKVSRWSKTTASSAAPDLAALDSPQQQQRGFKAPSSASASEASRSGSALGRYAEGDDGVGYALHDDDRLRSTQSLAKSQQGPGHHQQQAYAADTRSMRSQGSRLTRTPSPLIPSEASRDAYDDDDDGGSLDDPKYQAHRNSLLLEHPQPRQGPTGRYQNALESQAHQYFDDTTGTSSDVSQRTVSDFDPAGWGSSGTAGLARHKLTNFEPISPVSMNSPSAGGYGGGWYGGEKDDGPLVPQAKAASAPQQQQHPHQQHQEQEEEERYTFEPDHDWEPQFSNSGFSKGGGGGYYSSPYGSGHLLEPIEEVRYSLETDRSSHREESFSPEPQVVSAKAVDMRSPTQRKITGPRPMGARSPAPATQQPRLVEASGGGGGGTVRRKPVPRSEDGSIDSLESETF